VRKDNSQYRPEILIGGLVAVTKRFFLLPGLPSGLRKIRRRALSNCYVKIVQTLQYGRPEQRALRLRLRCQALIADPSNYRTILKTFRISHALRKPKQPKARRPKASPAAKLAQ
jgi:hypothetical protein